MTKVSTKAELRKAQADGAPEIEVVGELANKLNKAKKVAFAGKVALGVIVAALGLATVAAPETGGLSYFVVAPVAAITGMEITAIIAAVYIGLVALIALYKDYEEINFGVGYLNLRKKSLPPKEEQPQA
jgi:hypothetical protein